MQNFRSNSFIENGASTNKDGKGVLQTHECRSFTITDHRRGCSTINEICNKLGVDFGIGAKLGISGSASHILRSCGHSLGSACNAVLFHRTRRGSSSQLWAICLDFLLAARIAPRAPPILEINCVRVGSKTQGRPIKVRASAINPYCME